MHVMTEAERLLNLGLTPKLPEAFDSSMLRTWVDCPSQFYLRHILGLTLKRTEPNNALLWGTMWHTAHEVWSKTDGNIDLLVSEVFAEDKWPPSLDITDKQNRTRERMISLFVAYRQMFDPLFKKFRENLRTEQFFDIDCPSTDTSCPYGGCGLRWIGRWDSIDRWKNKILVWDYKTTGRMTADYFDAQKTGFQLPGYVWAANHVMPGEVAGARLDVMYVLKDKEEFLPRTFSYVPQAIAEWRENVKQYIHEIEDAWAVAPYEPEHPIWKKNWNECSRFGQCQFARVHRGYAPIGDTRLKVLAEDYVVDRWSPLQELE